MAAKHTDKGISIVEDTEPVEFVDEFSPENKMAKTINQIIAIFDEVKATEDRKNKLFEKQIAELYKLLPYLVKKGRSPDGGLEHIKSF